ncbi:YeiH family protein [Pontibacter ramchanderi]|uniref:Putative integral membrane protein (TIGR00698 family) n=1 Tax=Pontibacter ramchanderi TaxID=1179743 RepID=A0A2N3U8M5_9BACT|nr:putative sulfate exporter family transporter [Pontibacter ramchanderi]PKV63103.1 putative integral membrane protein (TIGR00698 family) [Pontibacter ramchanderi]
MPKLFPFPSPLLQKAIFSALVLLILFTPLLNSAMALAAGLVVGLLLGNPFQSHTGEISKYLLQAAVVGLGFGIDLYQVAETGLTGIVYTLVSLGATMLVGALLGKLFYTPPRLTHLVSSGTAICGGSAIAAVAPAIRASDQEISVALGIVFVLNAVALFIFPPVGAALGLTQAQFGTWAAIAIHDTSSVVGAATQYGEEALQIATTLKLTRALWIVPLVLVSSLLFKNGEKKLSIPTFILLFLLASVVSTFIPTLAMVSSGIVLLAKKGLLLSLFLIGANISPSALRSISAKPFWQGVLLWLFISATSLAVIYQLG